MVIFSSIFPKTLASAEESHEYLSETAQQWKEFSSVRFGTAEPPKENTNNPLTDMYTADLRQRRSQDAVNALGGTGSSMAANVLAAISSVAPDLMTASFAEANCTSVAETLGRQLSNITVTSARIYVPPKNNQSNSIHSVISSMFLSRTDPVSPLVANETGITRNETVLQNVEIRINKTQAMTIRDQLCPLDITLEQDCFNRPEILTSFLSQVVAPVVLSEVVCDEVSSPIEVITGRGKSYRGRHLENCQRPNVHFISSRVDPTSSSRPRNKGYKRANIAIVSDGVNTTKLVPIPGIEVTSTKCFRQYGDMLGNFCQDEILRSGSGSCRENAANRLRECADGSLVGYQLGQLVPGSKIMDLRASFYQKTGDGVYVRQLSESGVLASINTVLGQSSNARPSSIYVVLPPEQTTDCSFNTPAMERAVQQTRKEGIEIFVQVPNLGSGMFPRGVREVLSIEEALEVETHLKVTIPTEVATFVTLGVVLGIGLIAVAATVASVMKLRKRKEGSINLELQSLAGMGQFSSEEVINRYLQSDSLAHIGLVGMNLGLMSSERRDKYTSKTKEPADPSSHLSETASCKRDSIFSFVNRGSLKREYRASLPNDIELQSLGGVVNLASEEDCLSEKNFESLPRSFSFSDEGDEVLSLHHRSLSLDQVSFAGEDNLGVEASGSTSSLSEDDSATWWQREKERRKRWNAALDNFGGDSRYKLEVYDVDEWDA
ncbi:hypothetical protein [Candidatus Ichthyocystis hellenicum]|uniref:hypothetical protein n=1 Tax=Candidatus Ichthyocystis hellenicum TaxID=1561003 RepID=UPI000B82E474|nr:hypothetical protein [Candidatus Ichthyocystis hellenicum]